LVYMGGICRPERLYCEEFRKAGKIETMMTPYINVSNNEI